MSDLREIFLKAIADPELDWALKFVSHEERKKMHLEPSEGEGCDPFDAFAQKDVADKIRESLRVRGVHVSLCSREIGHNTGDNENRIINELRREGAFFCKTRSKVESERQKQRILAFTFSEVSEADELMSLSSSGTDLALKNIEDAMLDFNEDELPIFIEDGLRLRVYLDETTGAVLHHAFSFK